MPPCASRRSRRAASRPWRAQAAVELTGYPMAGEVWTVRLGDRSYAVTATQSGRSWRSTCWRRRWSPPSRADNTTAGVVTRLANAIDDRAGFDASVSGTRITIVRTGGVITAALKNGAGVVLSRVTSAAAQVVLDFGSAEVALGEAWTVEITQAGRPRCSASPPASAPAATVRACCWPT